MLNFVRSNGEILLQVHLADTFFSRLKGLLGSRSIGPNTGLLIRPCRCVHTLGMHYPIDLVFLSKNGVVVETINALLPNRIRYSTAAYQVLELEKGEVHRLGIKLHTEFKFVGEKKARSRDAVNYHL